MSTNSNSDPNHKKLPLFFRANKGIILTKHIKTIEPYGDKCYDVQTSGNLHFGGMLVCKDRSMDYELMKETFFGSDK